MNAALEDRWRSLGNVEFEYEVSAAPVAQDDWDFQAESVLPDGRVRSRDQFAIRVPPGSPRRLPWRAWRRFVSNGEGQTRLERMALWDGQAFTSLARAFSKEGSRPEVRIVAFEDRAQYADNWFDKVLFLNLHALPPYFDPDGSIRRTVDHGLRITNRGSEGGVETLTIEGGRPDVHLRFKIEVLGHPHWLVRRFLSHSEESGTDLMEYRVDEVSTFDGVSYPARGSVRQEPLGQQDAVHYDFRVTDVRRLAEDDARPWVLSPWAPGTIIADLVANRAHSIPVDLKEEARYIRRNRQLELAVQNASVEEAPSLNRFWLVANVLAITSVIAVYFAWRKLRT